jgi:hypothetical protein
VEQPLVLHHGCKFGLEIALVKCHGKWPSLCNGFSNLHGCLRKVA